MDLDQLRPRIDAIDDQVLDLLSKRAGRLWTLATTKRNMVSLFTIRNGRTAS